MSLLDGIGDALGDALSGGFNSLDRLVNRDNEQTRNFEKDGFIVPPIPSADGNGLPSSKIPSERAHKNKRHIMRFFVPEVGVINMYVNPQSIDYSFKKLISQDRTKGGYSLQYWGEELPTLNISGNTGSSGIEGLNVLKEVYRSEQLTFDAIGLTAVSNNSISGMADLIDNAAAGLSDVGAAISSLTNGALNLNPLTQSILPQNPTTLAQLAFGIEIFYAGAVYRGFFTSFNFKESVNPLGLFEYNMQFVITQTRGYRTNYMPWHRSATDGPSNNDFAGTPLSYNKKIGKSVSKNPNSPNSTILR